MKIKYLKLFLFVTAVAFMGLIGTAKAEIVGLGVDRSFIFLGHEDGKSNLFSFVVTNQNSERQIVHLEEKDINIGDNNEISFLDSGIGGPSSFVQFEKNDFLLQPNESVEVKGKINVLDSKIGEAKMLTMVYFKSENEISVGSAVGGNIGIYTFLNDEKLKNSSGKIIKIDFPRIINGGDSFSLQYANTGDRYFMPKGTIEIRNFIGGQSSQYVFDNHFVFPGKNVKFSLLDSPLLSKFGVYKMTAKFVDGNSDVSAVSSYAMGKYFIPLLIIIVAGLIFTALFIHRYRKTI